MQLFSLSLSEIGAEWMKGEREGSGKGEGDGGRKKRNIYIKGEREARGDIMHYNLELYLLYTEEPFFTQHLAIRTCQ